MMTNNAEPPLNDSRPIYVERVNAVIDYIEAHLAEDLSLATLAEVAHFSPYHFHRVFSTMIGETLSRFISRLRVERAATLLVQHPSSTWRSSSRRWSPSLSSTTWLSGEPGSPGSSSA
jgi:transcriptional regulator GlxA family with amidase domain